MTSWGSTGGRKPAINVGMIGPRGSGKTTLASVITKVLAGRGRAFARTPEELEGATRRGVYYTGPNYHVEYEGATRRYIHYDQPGALARARVAGPRQLDVGVVVVAADGPVTAGVLVESVTELRVAGVGAWLGFISKVELRAGARSLDATEAALREAMWTLGVDGDALTVIRGSARLVMEGERGALGAGAVHAYIEALERRVTIAARDPGAPLLMPIESVLSHHGQRCVVSGRIERGAMSLHQRASLLGSGGVQHPMTVAGLELLGRELTRAAAGDTLCVVTRGPHQDFVRPGTVIVARGSLELHRRVELRIDAVIRAGDEDAPDEDDDALVIPPGSL
ncbi:MAG: hypothetical protein KC468_11540, partial [Myxococcales bacterium]|nr:hypothetical protein [Myxococcales bacterium]